MRPLLAGLRFLTILPVPQRWGGEGEDLRRSLPFFPVIGALVGGVAAGVSWGLGYFLAPLPLAAVLVLVLAGSSGFMHLEGLADSADGLLSWRSRKRALEIMRDSRTGAMGVVAVVSVLLLKTALLASLTDPARWRMVFLAPLLSRCAMLATLAVMPYARPEGGLAALFQVNPKAKARWLLGAWAVLSGLAAAWLLWRWQGLLSAGVAALPALAFAACCGRRLGGYTGDTLGATGEIVECATFFAAAVSLAVPALGSAG